MIIDKWECHICGETREDKYISVHTKDISTELGFPQAGLAFQNVRYCNDKKSCKDQAASYSFFKKEDNEEK